MITSRLTVTEDTAGDYRYRCRVDITELGITAEREDVYPINVVDPAAPSFTDLTATSDFYDTATIQWTVPVIAYTPETYVVYYGTDNSTLDRMSRAVSSGSDFVITDQQFSIVLTDLTPAVVYYNQLVATNTFTSTASPTLSFTTPEQILLIQLQVTGILDCTQWTLQDPHGKLQDILHELPLEIEKLCTCGFTSQQLTEGEFQCLSQPDEVTYRARLSGTISRSSVDIVADIEEWIASGEANIKVQGVRRSLDSTCLPVVVETFDAQECGMGEIDDQTNTTSPSIHETSDTQSDNSVVAATAVSGVVAVVLIITLSVLFTVVFVLRHRRAELSIQRGETVKGGEVATSSNPWITTTECAAYGAPPGLPLQDLTESHDYEVITGRNDAYTPIQHSQRDESVEYENTYEVVSNN